jgi:hypothetical protein
MDRLEIEVKKQYPASKGEYAMLIHPKRPAVLFVVLVALTITIGLSNAVAQDVVHIVSGVVKHVDKDTKTMVVKTADGTEHTIKYTDDTVVKGTKDAAKGTEKVSADTYLATKEGAKVTVKYTEKGGEKTAVGIADASKATAKAVAQ